MNNFGEKASFIWSVADLLRGPYRPNQYKDVMLPMTVIRRLATSRLCNHRVETNTVPRPRKEAVVFHPSSGGKRKSLPSPASSDTWRPSISGLSSRTGVSAPVHLSTSLTDASGTSNSTVGHAV
jgi:hypothetical protein